MDSTRQETADELRRLLEQVTRARALYYKRLARLKTVMGERPSAVTARHRLTARLAEDERR